MGWFTNLCRNTGLMFHNIAHPEKDDSGKKVIRKEVEEEKVSENVTLRRTTIEEIEITTDDTQS
jgi:hypothetical protein